MSTPSSRDLGNTKLATQFPKLKIISNYLNNNNVIILNDDCNKILESITYLTR